MKKKGLMAAVVVIVLMVGSYVAYLAVNKLAQSQIDAVIAEISTSNMKIAYEDFKYNPLQNVLDIHNVEIKKPGAHHKFESITVKGANVKALEMVNDPKYYENRDKVSFNKIADSITFTNYESGKQVIDTIVVTEPSISQFDIVPTNENLESLTESQTLAMLIKSIKIPSVEIMGVKGKAFNDSVDRVSVSNLFGTNVGAIKVNNGTLYNSFGGKITYKEFSINGICYESFIKMLAENKTGRETLDSIGGAKFEELEFMAPDNSTVNIDSVELKKVNFSKGYPEQLGLSAKNVSPDIKTLDDRSKAMFSLLGYDELSLDFDLKLHVKQSDGKFLFSMDEMSFKGKDFGEMSFGFSVIGEDTAVEFTRSVPNSDTFAIGGIKYKFIDDSLMSRILKMYAQTTGMGEDAVKQSMLTGLNTMFDNNRYLAGYRESVINFITNPDAIEIVSLPSKPVPVSDLIKAAMKKQYPTIVRQLRFSVISNEKVSR